MCEDERQYVGWRGQEWVTLRKLATQGHKTITREVESGLWGVGVEPSFAIGQRGLIVTTPHGNVLWDVPGFVDDAAFAAVEDIGGLVAISASHPHFYGVMIEWAQRFEATIHLPAVDRAWVLRPYPFIQFYESWVDPVPGVRVLRCGGHFPGSAVLHWPAGADGRGALLTGDTLTVVPDRDWISIMWSYPNHIPLDAATLRRVESVVARLFFDRVYSGWWGRVISEGAGEKVAASIQRYIDKITAPG